MIPLLRNLAAAVDYATLRVHEPVRPLVGREAVCRLCRRRWPCWFTRDVYRRSGSGWYG